MHLMMLILQEPLRGVPLGAARLLQCAIARLIVLLRWEHWLYIANAD
jgi:hypothetical protein